MVLPVDDMEAFLELLKINLQVGPISKGLGRASVYLEQLVGYDKPQKQDGIRSCSRRKNAGT